MLPSASANLRPDWPAADDLPAPLAAQLDRAQRALWVADRETRRLAAFSEHFDPTTASANLRVLARDTRRRVYAAAAAERAETPKAANAVAVAPQPVGLTARDLAAVVRRRRPARLRPPGGVLGV